MSIGFEVDESEWIGDELDGCYVYVAQKYSTWVWLSEQERTQAPWYCTVVVDSETGSFVEDLMKDDGPYITKDEALEAGHIAAADWCLNNHVEFSC